MRVCGSARRANWKRGKPLKVCSPSWVNAWRATRYRARSILWRASRTPHRARSCAGNCGDCSRAAFCFSLFAFRFSLLAFRLPLLVYTVFVERRLSAAQKSFWQVFRKLALAVGRMRACRSALFLSTQKVRGARRLPEAVLTPDEVRSCTSTPARADAGG